MANHVQGADGGTFEQSFSTPLMHASPYVGVMVLTGPEAIALAFSGISLLVSAAVAIREFVARALPIAWQYEVSQRESGTWVLRGREVQMANVGRRPMIVEGLGQASGDDGWGSVSGEHLRGENPTFPRSLAPGEVIGVFLPIERFPDVYAPLRFVEIRRRGLVGRALRRQSVKRSIVPVKRRSTIAADLAPAEQESAAAPT
jgi:hypothetical protein